MPEHILRHKQSQRHAHEEPQQEQSMDTEAGLLLRCAFLHTVAFGEANQQDLAGIRLSAKLQWAHIFLYQPQNMSKDPCLWLAYIAQSIINLRLHQLLDLCSWKFQACHTCVKLYDHSVQCHLIHNTPKTKTRNMVHRTYKFPNMFEILWVPDWQKSYLSRMIPLFSFIHWGILVLVRRATGTDFDNIFEVPEII